VDEIGGLGAAIAKARELAKLPADAETETVGGPAGLLERLTGASAASPTAVSHAETLPSSWREGGLVVRELFAKIPGVVPFVESFAPLAGGERALTALPYALVIR
jgi:protease-4